MTKRELHAMVFDFDGTLADVCIDFAHMRNRSIQAAMKIAGGLLPIRPATDIDEAALSATTGKIHGSTPIISRRSPRRSPNRSTLGSVQETLRETLRETSREISHKSISGSIHDTGQPVLEWLAAACAHVGAFDKRIAEEMKDAVYKTIIDVEVEAAQRSELFTWTRPLLNTLRQHNIATLVITRNCRQAVETVFPDIHSLADAVLTREDVARVKPHPDHLHEALNIVGIAPEHAIMVGDHPMDIVTGKAAGTMTAGVTSGHASAEALSAESPDFLAENGYALYSILHRRFWPHTDRLILPPAA